MRKIDTNIWVHEMEFKLFGAEFGRRMTVLLLENGTLLLHSPGEITEELVKEIIKIGDVSYIVTPNNFHGMFAEDWISQFPEAVYYTAKEDDLEKGKGTALSELISVVSEEEIKLIKIEGAPKVNEYAILHRASGTLILTDIAFNIGSDVPIWTKIFFKLNGAFNSFGPTRMMKSMITNPEALCRSMSEILTFDFHRVIVSHGRILDVDAKERFRESFRPFYSVKSKRRAGRLSPSPCG